MENEYIKNLEEENAGLRKSIHMLEDALAEARKLADSKLFSIDDMRKMKISNFDFNILPTHTMSYQGKTHHLAGRPEISIKLEFDDAVVAMRLRDAIEGARNVK